MRIRGGSRETEVKLRLTVRPWGRFGIEHGGNGDSGGEAAAGPSGISSLETGVPGCGNLSLDMGINSSYHVVD